MHSPRHARLSYVIASGIFLAACGGGSGAGNTPVSASAPAVWFKGEGIYFTQTVPSSSPRAYSAYVTILSSGEYFSVNSDNLAGLDQGGLEHGTINGDTGSFSSTGSRIFFFGRPDPPSSTSLSGTYTSQSFSTTLGVTLLSGRTTYNNQGEPVVYSTVQDPRIIYTHPLDIRDIAGNFRGNMYGKLNDGSYSKDAIATFSIDAAGNYNAAAGACGIRGKMTQHLSAGVFDLSATISGAGCHYAGQMKGIVTPTHWETGEMDLQFQLFSADYTKALLLSALKP